MSPSKPTAPLTPSPSVLDLLPPIPYAYYPIFLLFYFTYVTLILIPSTLLVPTAVMGLVTVGTVVDFADDRGVRTGGEMVEYVTTRIRNEARGVLRRIVIPRIRSFVNSVRPPLLSMSVHDFMVEGAFMRRYGFLAIYMVGLGREDIESILDDMGGREREMVMSEGGIGRMIGWDRVESMLNDHGDGDEDGNEDGLDHQVTSPDLHLFDDSLPSTPVNTRQLPTSTSSETSLTPISMPPGAPSTHSLPSSSTTTTTTTDVGLPPGDVLMRYVAPIIIPRVTNVAREAGGRVRDTAMGYVEGAMNAAEGAVSIIGYGSIAVGGLGLGLSQFGSSIGSLIASTAVRFTAPVIRGYIEAVASTARRREGRGQTASTAAVVLGFGVLASWGAIRRNVGKRRNSDDGT